MDGAITEIKNWLGSGSINIFGMPFSGKDTQARKLARELDAPVVGGGEILRSWPDKEKIRQLAETGELFPSDFYLEVITPYLSKPEFAGKPLVLNSVGRWKGEETVITRATEKADHATKAVIVLGLTEAEVQKRFSASKEQQDRGHRHDDAEHLIEVRLNEFRTKTLPVIEFYRSKGLVVDVDGVGSVAEVSDRVIDALYNFMRITS